MRIGYARVSKDEQNLNLQLDALKKAECDKIYTDKGVSGANFSRPGLDVALASLSPGDVLVVWRMDRLGRSLRKLIDLVSYLGNRKIDFISLTEHVDTMSAGGTLIFHMMAALAEFERSLISERTRAGIEAARARGKPIGRRHSLTPSDQKLAINLAENHKISEIARRMNVHPRTIRRLVKKSNLPNY
ncbi:recombinase family protein [Burkholderia ubonensis]|uniref:recombinase family protein n=1 Tax=Burkholderia ubonensis TaxID=101571 RepID=UPI0009B2F44A|nr:recombinase family protein [Burkholderia ubonensis]